MNGRAFYRDYVTEGRRAGQVRRLHIIREDGPNPGREGYCSIHLRDVTHSRGIIIEPLPVVPPAGLQWCGTCLGRHVLHLGPGPTLAVAAIIASAGGA